MLSRYMVANARAISDVAKTLRNTTVASEYAQHASTLEKAIYTHLWDPKQQFFADVIRPNNSDLSPLHGREEVGFYPFRFGIGLAAKYSDPVSCAEDGSSETRHFEVNWDHES